MDVYYFFNSHVEFIQQFYTTASAPYVERKRKIEANEEPFVPPYSEDGEPQSRWLKALLSGSTQRLKVDSMRNRFAAHHSSGSSRNAVQAAQFKH